MKYITVASPNGRSFYLAKMKIGGGYVAIATFLNENTAQKTAKVLNEMKERADSEEALLREVRK